MNGFDVCKNLINSVRMEVFGNREKSGIFFFDWLFDIMETTRLRFLA